MFPLIFIFFPILTLNLLFALSFVSSDHLLSGYPGLLVLSYALCTFIAYMFTTKSDNYNAYTKVLFNTSIITSAVGLFMQIEGQWSAIIFLVYSCLILWYGLHAKLLRTIIYGFIFLIISIIKLYFAAPMLFETITGNILIMVIGLIIIFLSYKFEKIKDYVDNFETN